MPRNPVPELRFFHATTDRADVPSMFQIRRFRNSRIRCRYFQAENDFQLWSVRLVPEHGKRLRDCIQSGPFSFSPEAAEMIARGLDMLRRHAATRKEEQ